MNDTSSILREYSGPILITGGAGYIGLHLVEMFINLEIDFIVIDIKPYEAVKDIIDECNYLQVDICDTAKLKQLFSLFKFSVVIHLAGLKSVPESEEKPDLYIEVNVGGTKNLAVLCKEFMVPRFIFSSSAAVYGNFKSKAVCESDQTAPISMYGKTKELAELEISKVLADSNTSFMIFRYFNVGGSGRFRLIDKSKGNLIPIIVDNIANGNPIKIFGHDYDTPDNSCVRDYVHVLDIVDAHLKVITAKSWRSKIYNIGTGSGYSVIEVVEMVIKQLNSDAVYEFSDRRIGDVATLIANSDLIFHEIGFKCKYSLHDIVKSSVYSSD
jgi:UDP-glucose 4-epimerase